MTILVFITCCISSVLICWCTRHYYWNHSKEEPWASLYGTHTDAMHGRIIWCVFFTFMITMICYGIEKGKL